MILDSGATSHFLVVDAPRDDVRPALTPLTVCLPDGAQVHSSHTCSLRVNNLPQNACVTHVIPGLASHSLLSVVRLCNAGCEFIFTKIDCYVKYLGRTVLRGYKCNKTGLWMVNLQGCDSGPTPIQAIHLLANNIAETQLLLTPDIARIIANQPRHPLIVANQALQKLILLKPPNRHSTKHLRETKNHQLKKLRGYVMYYKSKTELLT